VWLIISAVGPRECQLTQRRTPAATVAVDTEKNPSCGHSPVTSADHVRTARASTTLDRGRSEPPPPPSRLVPDRPTERAAASQETWAARGTHRGRDDIHYIGAGTCVRARVRKWSVGELQHTEYSSAVVGPQAAFSPRPSSSTHHARPTSSSRLYWAHSMGP